MKRIYLFLLAFVSFVTAYSQERELEISGAWMKKHYAKAEYMIPMQDGAKLYTAVYTPKNKKIKAPILLCRTQNGCEPYGKKSMSIWRNNIYKQYLLSEYILVFQDVRGRGKSEGDFADAQLLSDSYRTIEWLQRKVRRHNGNVGVWGSGDDGVYALQAAICGHPSILAVSPQAVSQIVDVDTPTTVAMLFVGGLFDNVSKGNIWQLYKTHSGENSNNRIAVGPWLNNAWRENEGGVELGEVYFSEDADYSFFHSEIEFPFFDHYLRGGEDCGSSADALIYFTGENCWRELPKLNDVSTEESILYLHENNRLSPQQSLDVGCSTSYTFNPDDPTPYFKYVSQPIRPEYIVASQQFLDNRDDVVSFTTDILEEDITILGEIDIQLYVTTPEQGADVVLKIIDESANQEHEMMVRAEMFGKEYKGYELCGESGVRKYSFTLSDIAHTFFAGHRIKLQIQSAWYPLSDVTQKTIYNVHIHHDKEYPSAIRFKSMK